MKASEAPQNVDNKTKWQISKWVFQENKARQIFRKTNISYPLIQTRTFFGKFGVPCFLETPVLRFALLPYYRRKKSENQNLFKYNFLNCLGRKWLSLPKIFLSASCVLYKSDVYFFDFVSCSIQIFPSANLFSINLLLLNLKLTSQV